MAKTQPAPPPGVRLSPLPTIRGREAAHAWIAETLGVSLKLNYVRAAATKREIRSRVRPVHRHRGFGRLPLGLQQPRQVRCRAHRSLPRAAGADVAPQCLVDQATHTYRLISLNWATTDAEATDLPGLSATSAPSTADVLVSDSTRAVTTNTLPVPARK